MIEAHQQVWIQNHQVLIFIFLREHLKEVDVYINGFNRRF